MQQVADKMNFQDPVQKYAECHSWDMSNSNATKYHEIKVGILDNTCFKENVPTFEILVGWILRLGLNFLGNKCRPLWLEMWSCLPRVQFANIRKMVFVKASLIVYVYASTHAWHVMPKVSTQVHMFDRKIWKFFTHAYLLHQLTKSDILWFVLDLWPLKILAPT